eukprot:743949_1
MISRVAILYYFLHFCLRSSCANCFCKLKKEFKSLDGKRYCNDCHSTCLKILNKSSSSSPESLSPKPLTSGSVRVTSRRPASPSDDSKNMPSLSFRAHKKPTSVKSVKDVDFNGSPRESEREENETPERQDKQRREREEKAM